MKSLSKIMAVLTLALSSTTALLAAPPTSTEQFHYAWHLKGGLAWVASLRFPTSGYGELKTVRSSSGSDAQLIDTQLRITPKEGDDFYLYQSQIDGNGKTLMTYHGYSWGDKYRRERTFFDYVKNLARIRKETDEKIETRVKPMQEDSIRDVLTAIFYLRQNAATIHGPFTSDIYSDGKLYPVIFEPQGRETLTIVSRQYATRVYKVSATPTAQKKWPGAVRVWLADDSSAIPVRIEMQRNFATLRLDLDQL